MRRAGIASFLPTSFGRFIGSALRRGVGALEPIDLIDPREVS
jgi:hypothetical protein